MKLSEYPKPANDTGIGWHLSPNGAFPMGECSSDWQLWVDRLKAMGASWVKMIAFGASALDLCRFLRERDIMPIVRLYRPAPNPGSMIDDDPAGCAAVKQYIAIGCKYFEVNNEPNLFDPEWAGEKNAEGIPALWQEWNPNQPTPVADSWVRDAKFILDRGGLPGIPAMAPGGNIDDQDFLSRFFDRIIATGNTEIMGRGVWLSVHPAGLNHPLDYPEDVVNQFGVTLEPEIYDAHQWRGDRAYVNGERTRGKNRGQTIMDPGASNGWRKWEMVETLFEQKFGFKVPVLATEGGFWIGEGQDPRYHILNEWDVSYLTRTTSEAIMNGQYPDWFFCTGYWLLASKGMGGTMAFEHQAAYSPMAPNGNYWPVVDNLRDMVKHVRFPYIGAPPPITPPASTILTDIQIAQVCKGAGFFGKGWTTAVTIALAESGGNYMAVGDIDIPGPGDSSNGLFQFNTAGHPEVTKAMAFDPAKAAIEAYRVSGGGRDWSQWSTFNNGDYLSFWKRAAAVTCLPGPPDDELRNFAYWNVLYVPYNPEAALMKEAIRLGGVPLSSEGSGTISCAQIVGQVFIGPVNGTVSTYLLYCRDGDYGKVYQFIL